MYYICYLMYYKTFKYFVASIYYHFKLIISNRIVTSIFLKLFKHLFICYWYPNSLIFVT